MSKHFEMFSLKTLKVDTLTQVDNSQKITKMGNKNVLK
jgi:hypothetical protein